MILGSVGRNFGAGMGGGVVYILDEDDDLEARCHTPSVLLEDIAPEDEESMLLLLEKHARFTGSAVAAALLNDWPAAKQRFRRVTPRNKPIWETS